MWAMSSFPRLSDEERAALSSPDEVKRAELARCYAGRLGQALAPVLKPLGFDWRITTALVPAFATKEAFVTQMGIVFNLGEAHKDNRESLVRLQAELRRHYTPLVGLCVVIFILVSAPCMSTIAVTWRESGHWKWAVLQFAGHMAVGYLVTLVIYQLGALLGLGTRQVMAG
jgi:ferrous iron transport protein B